MAGREQSQIATTRRLRVPPTAHSNSQGPTPRRGQKAGPSIQPCRGVNQPARCSQSLRPRQAQPHVNEPTSVEPKQVGITTAPIARWGQKNLEQPPPTRPVLGPNQPAQVGPELPAENTLHPCTLRCEAPDPMRTPEFPARGARRRIRGVRAGWCGCGRRARRLRRPAR